MPRYTDEWVIDRVLFDYVAGGSCACCGLQHFLPNSTTADLIAAVSDLETDAANSEVAALAFHPWPVELRDQIWADRVRLRQRMKRKTAMYRDFWQQHGAAFADWCRHGGGHDTKEDGGGDNECLKMHTRWLQLPRSEVMEFLREEYNVHAAFAVVLCTVLEQVAAFSLTQYPPDGRGSVELHFERILFYDRRGGFTLNLVLSSEDDDKNNINGKNLPPRRKWSEENLNIWLEQMRSLGGPKLLERGPSTTTTTSRSCGATDDDDDGDAGDADDAPAQPKEQKPSRSSFQSDRRILRSLIARYWANIFQQKYLASISSSRRPVDDAPPNNTT